VFGPERRGRGVVERAGCVKSIRALVPIVALVMSMLRRCASLFGGAKAVVRPLWLCAVFVTVVLVSGGAPSRASSAIRGSAAEATTVDCTADPGALAGALAGAVAGATLTIQGSCEGEYVLTRSVTLEGAGAVLASRGTGRPVLRSLGGGWPCA
jgi:hypothetical protein